MPIALALLNLKITLPEHLDRICIVLLVGGHALQLAVGDAVALYHQLRLSEGLQVDQVAHL